MIQQMVTVGSKDQSSLHRCYDGPRSVVSLASEWLIDVSGLKGGLGGQRPGPGLWDHTAPTIRSSAAQRGSMLYQVLARTS